MGKGTREEWDKGNPEKELAKGDAGGQSTPDSRETSWHEIGSRAVRVDRSRWVGIPSSFVEISLEVHASVSLHMHKGMQCYMTPLLALKLTQAYCSFVLCSFSPAPLIVFLVAMKKCAIPLSEPLDDHRPRSEMVRRSWRIRGGGRGGIVTNRVQAFLKGISPKVNVIGRLEFELAYSDITVQYVSNNGKLNLLEVWGVWSTTLL